IGLVPCTDQSLKSVKPLVRAHESFSLCCEIKAQFCDRNDLADSNRTLVLLPRRANGSLFEDGDGLDMGLGGCSQIAGDDGGRFNIQREGACKVNITLSAPPGLLEFCCVWDSVVVMTKVVDVIPEPSQPEIAHIVTSPTRDITLTFDRGPFNPIFNDSYTVTMTDPWSSVKRNVIMCKGNHSPDSKLCERGSSICVCRYSETDGRLKNIPSNNVTFTVTVSRLQLYHVERTLWVNLIHHSE
ncbi:hypothetical protein PoB_001772300, partial [Plakobranchus ocellatus]